MIFISDVSHVRKSLVTRRKMYVKICGLVNLLSTLNISNNYKMYFYFEIKEAII